MYSQTQSTNFSILQSYMERLQGWADELVKNGRGKDLQNLLAALPTFQKLSDLGIGLKMSISIHNIGEIELVDLEELAKTVSNNISEIEQENALAESSNSSQDQGLLTAFKRNINQEVQTYYARLTESDTSLETLNIMTKALIAFTQNTGSKFVDLMEKAGATEIWRRATYFYTTFHKQIIRNYIDYILIEINDIEQHIQRQIRKNRIIVTQPSSQSNDQKPTIQQKKDSKNQKPITNKQKPESLKNLKPEESAEKSGKKFGEKSQKYFEKLPYLFPKNSQKNKSKPKN